MNRLKTLLSKTISESQVAPILSRMITDNVTRISQLYMTTKTDISKAYDRLEAESKALIVSTQQTWRMGISV